MTSTSVFSALAPYGWDEAWADAFAPYEPEGLLPGRVVRVDRGQCDIVTADGTLRADTAFVTPHDPLRVLCTGDWAVVEPAGTPRYVRTYLPRRTAFVRCTSSKRSEGQILAANVDTAIVAVSLAVELDLGRIERFLALAWESGTTVQRVKHAQRMDDPGGAFCRSHRARAANHRHDRQDTPCREAGPSADKRRRPRLGGGRHAATCGAWSRPCRSRWSPSPRSGGMCALIPLPETVAR